MSEAHERLTYYIKNQGFELKDFCAQYGFTYNSFTQILAGTRPLGRKILDQLIDALPNLSADWLLYGRGQMEIVDPVFTNKNVNYGVQDDNKMLVVTSPNTDYNNIDPGKKMLLSYLNDPDVQNMIRQIMK